MLYRICEVHCSKNSPKNLKVVTLLPGGLFKREIEKLEIEVFEMLSLNFRSHGRFIKFLFGNEVDTIFGWMYWGNLLALIIRCFKTNSRLIWNIRQTLYSINLEKRSTKVSIILNKIFSFCPDNIFFNSHISLKQHKAFGFKNKFQVIPNFYDTALLKSGVNQKKKGQNFKIGMFARFHPMKNHKGFTEAILELMERQPDLLVNFVGSGLEAGCELQSMIPEKFKSQFVFCGHQENIYPIYQETDLIISPSLWGEGFQNVLLESIMQGIPCISTRIGEAEWILEEKDNFLINPGHFKQELMAKVKSIRENYDQAVVETLEIRKNKIKDLDPNEIFNRMIN